MIPAEPKPKAEWEKLAEQLARQQAQRDPLQAELDVLAARIGPDAAEALRRRFAEHRPAGPRRSDAHLGDPIVRVTDPI
jgi:hypothetical protein